MKEDFLHYVWKFKKFANPVLTTVNNQSIEIINLGQHNFNAGPDFFNAQVIIDNQKWAGNIEIHIKSSDWYLHNHERDSAYDNVILHVVWEHDTDIYRKDNTIIPTLELKNYIPVNVLHNYERLITSKSWINCEKDFPSVDNFTIDNWIERLYIERIERKSKTITKLLETTKNDWEAVLFKMLCKNFGLNINGESFLSIANSIEYSIIRKTRNDITDLEALLFGQGKLLDDTLQDSYYSDLKKRYSFLKHKYNLDNTGVIPLQFFRLRPPNFPTIRLGQLAQLYSTHSNLFTKLVTTNDVQSIYDIFNVETNSFWKTHYTFSTVSKSKKKNLSQSFIDLLLINTVLPLKFSYAKSLGRNIENEILDFISNIDIENNSIVNKFLALKAIQKNALISQALIELKHNYCDKNKCISCAIGNQLIVK